VNSKRQLWSVAGYLAMVAEGVFGFGPDGSIDPKLPSELVPALFGDRETISLQWGERHVTLRRPRSIEGNLLVAGRIRTRGHDSLVELVGRQVETVAMAGNAAAFAPASPPAPQVERVGEHWKVAVPPGTRLYLDGVRQAAVNAAGITLPSQPAQQCVSLTRVGADGIESLHGPTVCIGNSERVVGEWPRQWVARQAGRYRVNLQYDNANGPINTGITAAVKQLMLDCEGQPQQSGVVVMPHSDGSQTSSPWTFTVPAATACKFALVDGFNMSYLRHFRHYTGGRGGEHGPLNSATLGALTIVSAPAPASEDSPQ